MRKIAAFVSPFLAIILLLNNLAPALACGPTYLEPIFVLDNSPDLPFNEYAGGKIGIIKPSYGRKALFIAYRYINNSSFSADEQTSLVEAMKGEPPEGEDDGAAVKKWIEARKQVVKDEKLPDIYTERRYEGYNFFPNCTKNAFEVATETLNNRVGSYGAEDKNVGEWIRGQDAVFQICSSGNEFPAEVGAESPTWLRKDRAYQIAAAHFYSLNFNEARQRFEKIAADSESDWQQTADYLVARTLVRQASLTDDKTKSREIYEQAEQHLSQLLSRSGKFYGASLRLLGLIKYRLCPVERARELAQTLDFRSGNENLRQDLIDYTWLLDKFEAQVLAEEEKKRAEKAAQQNQNSNANVSANANVSQKDVAETNANKPVLSEWEIKQQAITKGEVIEIGLSYKKPEKEYSDWLSLQFQPDATDEEIYERFEREIGRKLTAEENEKIKESKLAALAQRSVYLGANYKFSQNNAPGYEGDYSDEQMPFAQIPDFLRSDELTDWILTFQNSDAQSYSYSLQRWRETDSPVWLIAALSKADKNSAELARLLADAEKANRDAAPYPTVAFHTARLLIETGKRAEARKLLDELLAASQNFPISSQNQFLELRMPLAETFGEFLRFAGRKPFAFTDEGFYGSIDEHIKQEKEWWNAENYKETKEEWEKQVENAYRTAKMWESGLLFDEKTLDVINRHFSLAVLREAAKTAELSEFMRRQFILAAWTRAVLLGDEKTALQIAPQVLENAPEMSEVFQPYLNARTPAERRTAELWIFLKNPTLTPFVVNGDGRRYYLEPSAWEDNWWILPSETEYNDNYEEVPKTIPAPSFITAAQLAAAKKEREKLEALGDAETYISNRVFHWAAKSPKDPRIPEALFIVAEVNTNTKYYSGDEELREKAKKMLETRYPNSPWTAKLKEEEN